MRAPLVLYGLALLVRLLLIWHFPDPAYPDAAYYVDVARSLQEGRGFTVDFVWIFAEVGGSLPADPVLPIASNAHWMPLASVVQVPFLAALGQAPWVAALPFALFGALAAPLTWFIARDAGTRPLVAWGAGILVAVPLLTTPFMAQPDNFSLYQPLVAGALWMIARSLRGSGPAFIAAGILVGLATLARTDGILVLATMALAVAWDRTAGWRTGGSRRAEIPWRAVLLGAAAFGVLMGPWWLRQLEVFGSLSPSTASGKVLFIRDIGEWNSITTPATLEHLLGMGAGPLLATRLGGLVAAVMIFVTLVCGLALALPMAMGAWSRRRSIAFGPFFVYAALLFLFSGLVSAVHVPGGTFIHSAVALAPHGYILAIEGIAVAVTWIAARRRSWHLEQATRIFTLAALVFALATASAGALSVHGTWSIARSNALAVGEALDRAGASTSDRVMSIDAASTRYFTGRGGVVLVNDPLETIRAVIDGYRIRWLVLDRSNGVQAVEPILDGRPRPAWLGPPVFSQGTPPAIAVFPVVDSGK